MRENKGERREGEKGIKSEGRKKREVRTVEVRK